MRRTLYYYTKQDLAEAGVPLGIHRLRMMMRAGIFPRSFSIGPGEPAFWLADEVDEFVRNREAAKAAQKATGLGRHSGRKAA